MYVCVCVCAYLNQRLCTFTEATQLGGDMGAGRFGVVHARANHGDAASFRQCSFRHVRHALGEHGPDASRFTLGPHAHGPGWARGEVWDGKDADRHLRHAVSSDVHPLARRINHEASGFQLLEVS